jgi:hypothetical protein
MLAATLWNDRMTILLIKQGAYADLFQAVEKSRLPMNYNSAPHSRYPATGTPSPITP